jgi:hypothetical protein
LLQALDVCSVYFCLVMQIHEEAKKFSYQTGVRVVVAYGGAPIHNQVWFFLSLAVIVLTIAPLTQIFCLSRHFRLSVYLHGRTCHFFLVQDLVPFYSSITHLLFISVSNELSFSLSFCVSCWSQVPQWYWTYYGLCRACPIDPNSFSGFVLYFTQVLFVCCLQLLFSPNNSLMCHRAS